MAWLGTGTLATTLAFPSFFQATPPLSVIQCGSSFLVPCFMRRSNCFLICFTTYPDSEHFECRRPRRLENAELLYPGIAMRPPAPGADIDNQSPIYGNIQHYPANWRRSTESIGELCRIAICNALPCPAPTFLLASGRKLGTLVRTRRMEKHRIPREAR